jgi:hypothetical protein
METLKKIEFNNFVFFIKIVILTLKQNSTTFSTLCSQK